MTNKEQFIAKAEEAAKLFINAFSPAHALVNGAIVAAIELGCDLGDERRDRGNIESDVLDFWISVYNCPGGRYLTALRGKVSPDGEYLSSGWDMPEFYED